MNTEKATNEFIEATMKVKYEPESITWKKSKMSWTVWCQIVSFFRDSYKKFKSESQVRLFFNNQTGEWRAWAFTQETRGMTVKEVESEQKAIDHRQFGNDWMPIGTAHHHCTGTAFQSGTDHADEINQEGLHITVGYIDKDEVDIHARFVYKKQMYDVDLVDFIECPEDNVNPVYRKIMDLIYVTIPLEAEYPDQWLKNVTKPVQTFHQPTFNKGKNWSSWGYKQESLEDFCRKLEMRTDDPVRDLGQPFIKNLLDLSDWDEDDVIGYYEDIASACDLCLDEIINELGQVDLDALAAIEIMKTYGLTKNQIEEYTGELLQDQG